MNPSHADEPHVLREYALLADGERGVLVGPHGDVAWMCFPRWDSDALFSALIGGGGTYAVTPKGRFVWGGYYERATLIWHSRWVTDENAIVECREALALPARPERAVLLRRVVALRDEARVEVVLRLLGRFGSEAVRDLSRTDDGCWVGRVGDLHACWAGAAEAQPRDGALELHLRLDDGERHDLVLVVARDPKELEPPDPTTAWSATEEAWRESVPRLDRSAAPRDARHAYAVLSGLTGPSGGLVAAATTSLPERAREGKSYDYRYVWIRDHCYCGQAVAAAGPYPLLDSSVRFVRERLLEDGRELRPVYTTTGGRVPDERSLDLVGYPGGTDVVGNHAAKQFQLDAFGEALLLFAAAARHDRLDAETWRAAEIAAEAIHDRWRERDAGIWELDPDEWTHSRLICAAGLRAIAARGPGKDQAARWLALADAITADAAARCLHPTGRWQRSPTDERIDCALLMPTIRGAIAPDDPRSVETLRAVEGELTEDGYAYRYRPDARPLGEAEGAFLLCGFVLSLAHAQRGDHVAAARWFERNRAACGPPGLLAEEFDVLQRQLRGNLPQAFVHALLLECAVSLEVSGGAAGDTS
ncbi:MAG TPA: glycoside hydrolase family 15 protein [Gaiellaceae bacterium]